MTRTTALALPPHCSRLQSPSSINTWKQCPRKYYYRYVAGLPSKPSIHLLRGSITHTALERFFDTDVTNVPDEKKLFFTTMRVILYETFKREWSRARPKLEGLGLSEEVLTGYYDETKLMLANYFEYFTSKIAYFTSFLSIKEAWDAVKPSREMEFVSVEHGVHGFIDAIHDESGKTIIIDYKTSRKAKVTEEYALQLAIYALLYEEKVRRPDLVGIYFLKEGREELFPVTSGMIERAKEEVLACHLGTRSRDVGDYPKRPGPLCKWATGQCDYYEYCFEGKRLPGA